MRRAWLQPPRRNQTGEVSPNSSSSSPYSEATTAYILKTKENLFPLEARDLNKPSKEIQKHLSGEQLFIIPSERKTQKYYEEILLQTKSVQIQHYYRYGDYAYSKISIQHILTIEDWNPQEDYSHTQILNTPYEGEQFNYWDYQAAWTNFLYIQNEDFKHSWFIIFSFRVDSLPVWFYHKWWLNFGASPAILSTPMKKAVTETFSVPDELSLLRFCARTGFPWILR